MWSVQSVNLEPSDFHGWEKKYTSHTEHDPFTITSTDGYQLVSPGNATFWLADVELQSAPFTSIISKLHEV